MATSGRGSFTETSKAWISLYLFFIFFYKIQTLILTVQPQLPQRTRSSKVKSGVEHRVSSLDSSRCESLEQGVWGLEAVSGLAGLMGDGTWL